MSAPLTNFVTLQEMLARLDADEIVSMVVVKYNASKGTAGGLMHIGECQQLNADGKAPSEAGSTPSEASSPAEGGIQDYSQEEKRRNPHHFEHFTRNVRLFSAGQPTKEIRKIHPQLVVEFCGASVL